MGKLTRISEILFKQEKVEDSENSYRRGYSHGLAAAIETLEVYQPDNFKECFNLLIELEAGILDWRLEKRKGNKFMSPPSLVDLRRKK